MLPTIEVMAFKSSKVMVPAIRPTKQLSISRAFLLCWLTIRHQRAPRIYWWATGSCCHSACWWCTLREWRSVPYQHQLSAACRPWAVPCSRYIWHLRACESCRGSHGGVRPGIIALLWLLRCSCHATAIIVGAVMVGLALLLLLLLLWAIIGAIADGKSCAGGLLLHRLLLPW